MSFASSILLALQLRRISELTYPAVLMECNAHASLAFRIGFCPPLARYARAEGSKLLLCLRHAALHASGVAAKA